VIEKASAANGACESIARLRVAQPGETPQPDPLNDGADAREFLTPRQVWAWLQMCNKTFGELVQEGKIRSIKLGPRCTRYYRPHVIEDLLKLEKRERAE
jgi:hypothetical protein